MARVAVLGGGISGLSTAYYLTKAPVSKIKQVVLFESSSRLGGWLQTSRFDDGTIFEHGPRNLTLTGRPGRNTLQLAEELGLEDHILPCTKRNKSAKTQFLYVNDKIHQVPNSLGKVFTKQPPFSKSLAAQLWKEPFTRSIHKDDESIHDFITRRLGREVAKYLFDPISRAIFQGSSKELSMKACFRDIFHWEQEYGSIVTGAIRAPKDKTKVTSRLLKRAKNEKWKFWSTTSGLEKIPESISSFLSQNEPRVSVHVEAKCSNIKFEDNRVKLRCNDNEETFDHVFAAIPGPQLAQILPQSHDFKNMTSSLAQIKSNSCAVVSLQYEGNILPKHGVGHLVPSFEPSKVSCILYESCTFPKHGARDRPTTRLTLTMGGSEFEELFGPVDQAKDGVFADTAMSAVRDHLGVSQQPTRLLVRLQKECLPQYIVGHAARVEDVMTEVATKQLPLFLIGAAYKGVSVNDCIYNAKTEVDDLLGRFD